MFPTQETMQFQDVVMPIELLKEQQHKKFDIDMQKLLLSYEKELEALNIKKKYQIEKAKNFEMMDLKNTSKKLKHEQERCLKIFRDGLKLEFNLLKHQCNHLLGYNHKETYRIKKQLLHVGHAERERNFFEKLNNEYMLSMKKLSDEHRKKIACLEKQFLMQKHQLLLARQIAIRKLEEPKLQKKHALLRKQLEDTFSLQCQQLLSSHQKEMRQMKEIIKSKEESLAKMQATDKKELAKKIHNEMKSRELMFCESLLKSITNSKQRKKEIKIFQEQEKIKYDEELKLQDLQHKCQLEEIRTQADSNVKVMELFQNEKMVMLKEQENHKLKCQDEEYLKKWSEWKKKAQEEMQKLEEEFDHELKEQEDFYELFHHSHLYSLVTPF